MTLVQTLLVLLLVPVAIYAVITLLTMWPRLTRRTRYRTGQDWTFAPVYWVANPENLDFAPSSDERAQDARPSTATGGARGNW